ncbi:uncharacterized protein CMU_015410 [Cryptosporidium muris RN66]|uniref:Uncharacterized protein n=1 Tax=Cryptosporidium muris (strain RN66) TaxID=441375 RepID=B6AEB8_CRYMR|nr:uncharacterized protein CMU_015410 [Cryptosporidium muris RN66]EEA06864.1 hypothetical protein, conserved [Cryptosporidium muris RN66]|eukprot:XP_002141213.1 hypothetical protein [Cryptosporidium muris RN66]
MANKEEHLELGYLTPARKVKSMQEDVTNNECMDDLSKYMEIDDKLNKISHELLRNSEFTNILAKIVMQTATNLSELKGLLCHSLLDNWFKLKCELLLLKDKLATVNNIENSSNTLENIYIGYLKSELDDPSNLNNLTSSILETYNDKLAFVQLENKILNFETNVTNLEVLDKMFIMEILFRYRLYEIRNRLNLLVDRHEEDINTLNRKDKDAFYLESVLRKEVNSTYIENCRLKTELSELKQNSEYLIYQKDMEINQLASALQNLQYQLDHSIHNIRDKLRCKYGEIDCLNYQAFNICNNLQLETVPNQNFEMNSLNSQLSNRSNPIAFSENIYNSEDGTLQLKRKFDKNTDISSFYIINENFESEDKERLNRKKAEIGSEKSKLQISNSKVEAMDYTRYIAITKGSQKKLGNSSIEYPIYSVNSSADNSTSNSIDNIMASNIFVKDSSELSDQCKVDHLSTSLDFPKATASDNLTLVPRSPVVSDVIIRPIIPNHKLVEQIFSKDTDNITFIKVKSQESNKSLSTLEKETMQNSLYKVPLCSHSKINLYNNLDSNYSDINKRMSSENTLQSSCVDLQITNDFYQGEEIKSEKSNSNIMSKTLNCNPNTALYHLNTVDNFKSDKFLDISNENMEYPKIQDGTIVELEISNKYGRHLKESDTIIKDINFPNSIVEETKLPDKVIDLSKGFLETEKYSRLSNNINNFMQSDNLIEETKTSRNISEIPQICAKPLVTCESSYLTQNSQIYTESSDIHKNTSENMIITNISNEIITKLEDSILDPKIALDMSLDMSKLKIPQSEKSIKSMNEATYLQSDKTTSSNKSAKTPKTKSSGKLSLNFGSAENPKNKSRVKSNEKIPSFRTLEHIDTRKKSEVFVTLPGLEVKEHVLKSTKLKKLDTVDIDKKKRTESIEVASILNRRSLKKKLSNYNIFLNTVGCLGTSCMPNKDNRTFHQINQNLIFKNKKATNFKESQSKALSKEVVNNKKIANNISDTIYCTDNLEGNSNLIIDKSLDTTNFPLTSPIIKAYRSTIKYLKSINDDNNQPNENATNKKYNLDWKNSSYIMYSPSQKQIQLEPLNIKEIEPVVSGHPRYSRSQTSLIEINSMKPTSINLISNNQYTSSLQSVCNLGNNNGISNTRGTQDPVLAYPKFMTSTNRPTHYNSGYNNHHRNFTTSLINQIPARHINTHQINSIFNYPKYAASVPLPVALTPLYHHLILPNGFQPLFKQ